MMCDLKIDHVTVCGTNLADMRRGFDELGIETEYGGTHRNQLTEMALAGFEDGSYLELIAPVVGADLVHASGMMAGWVPLMVGNAGAGAWAIRVSRIQSAADALRARGIEVRGPEPGGRTKPDGTRLEWETAVLGPGAAGSLLPFMIEDRTERSLRVRSRSHQQSVSGVVAVVVGVRELDRAIDLYRRAYGLEPASIENHPEFGVRLAHFKANPVILAESLTDEWVSRRLTKFGEGPIAFLFRAEKPPVGHEARWFGWRIAWLKGRHASARVGFISD